MSKKETIEPIVKKIANYLKENPTVVKKDNLEEILLKLVKPRKIILSPSSSEEEKVVKKLSSSSEEIIPTKTKIRIKKQDNSEDEYNNATWTLTFGECSENRVGNEQIGKKADEGFNLKDLKKAKAWFEEKGITCELVCLNDYLTEKAEAKTGKEADKAYILIARNGLSAIAEPDDVLKEQKGATYDRKAWMRGRVVNLKARYAICYADKGHKADYENKEGTVVAFSKMPLLNKIREEIPNIVGKKGKGFTCEGNLYYDVDSKILYHSDLERTMVFAVRLGQTMKLAFTWFYRYVAISNPIKFTLNHGDIYISSEKAVGPDGNRPSIITLRHAAGPDKYLTWKPRKKSSTKKSSKKKASSSESSSSSENVDDSIKKKELSIRLLDRTTKLYEKNKSYERFWSYMVLRLYIKYMAESDRYELEDMETYDLKKDLAQKEIILNIADTLKEFYSLYSPDSVKDIENILEKYRTWYSVLLQKLYRKYIDKDFEVDEDQNSYPDIVVI